MWITSFVFVGLLVAEFVALVFGFSVMYKEVNVMQTVLHGLGVLCSIWMILDYWRY